MIVIIGATGHIGSKITEQLASLGKKVKGIARNPKSAKFLKDLGAESAVGDIGDTKFLTDAFKDADAVFAMIPPKYTSLNFRDYMNKMEDSIIEAVQLSGVKYIVALSSIGAHLPESNGIVQGLYDFEQKLGKLKDTNILILRPAYFMENLFNNIRLIKESGINGSSTKRDIAFPLTATKDIAKVASEHLIDLNFKDHSVEYVLGPKDYNWEEITKILGKAIGKEDLTYVEFPYRDSVKAIARNGISQSNAEGLVGIEECLNEGLLIPEGIRNKKNTTPTRLEELSEAFKNAYTKAPGPQIIK